MTIFPISDLSRPETTIAVAGDCVTIDGIEHDFSALVDGGEARAPQSTARPFRAFRLIERADENHEAVIAMRIDGIVHVRISVSLGPKAAPCQSSNPLVIEQADGLINLRLFDALKWQHGSLDV